MRRHVLLPGDAVIGQVIQMTRLPESPFTFASDRSPAQATGKGTLLGGSVEFHQTSVYEPDRVLGTVTGDFAAHFDGLGLVQPAVGAQTATLGNP
jgi:hypothetical protein